jgi:hypothetical protein
LLPLLLQLPVVAAALSLLFFFLLRAADIAAVIADAVVAAVAAAVVVVVVVVVAVAFTVAVDTSYALDIAGLVVYLKQSSQLLQESLLPS